MKGTRTPEKAKMIETELDPSLLLLLLPQILPLLIRRGNRRWKGSERSAGQLSTELKNLQLLRDVSPNKFPRSKTHC